MSKAIVDKNALNHYKLKITTLSPIHIGTGEVYEPTNFVIDNNTLYAFDEMLFYKSLNISDKQKLNAKLGNWMEIIDFYKDHLDVAKEIAFFNCNVSRKISERYIGRRNRDGSINYNQLQINTTFKNPNTHRAIIPGSSIKGMLDTVFQIYPKKIQENAIRQKLIISDVLLLDGGVEVGYSYRRHKNPSKEARSDIPQMVEVVRPESSFICDIYTEYSFLDIQKKMKYYHEHRQDSKYDQTENSFIARIGKYSGKEYMVDNGRNVLNSYDKPIATHTIYEKGDSSFGWIKVEHISDNEYESSLKDISNQEKEYYKTIEEKQKSIKDSIQKIKDEAIALKLKKEAEEKAQKEAEEKAKIKREQELASMDPIDKIIDSFENDVSKVINAMKDGSIENIDDIKVELAQKLKEIMQKDPKQWDKAKQKALKRKEYIEDILGV